MKDMRTTRILLFAIATILFCACGNSSQKGLNEMNTVATKTQLGYAELISCDFTKLKDTIDLPLSTFIGDLKMVKLDNKDEALIGRSLAIVTEHYILTRNNKQNPFKLFDKQGKFLTAIGAYGQGPGEYLNVYDEYLDDANETIYILPWQSDKLLRFKTDGTVLEPIPLCHRAPKGKFYIDAKNKTVSVFLLPFKGIADVAWTQDFEGNMLKSVPAGHLSVQPDFSNEVTSNKNVNAFDCSLFTFWGKRPDSLYHYNLEKNTLDAKFTLDFNGQPYKIHWYEELPNHFLGSVTVEKKLSNNTSTTEYPAKYIVDKKTLKGAFYRLYNDFLGNIPIKWVAFHHGYYVWNVEPAELGELLSKQIKDNPDMESAIVKKLQEIIDGIDEDDNNYIFYGKLKR